MLNSSLTVVDNHASLTLPGSAGSQTYDTIVSSDLTRTLRRRSDTANTKPAVISVKHDTKGAGFNARIRSEVKYTYQDLEVDSSETGGVTPQVTVGFWIERPVKSGGAITSTVIKNAVGAVLDVVLTSGQLDKLLNQEG